MNRSSCHRWIKPPSEDNLLNKTPNARGGLPSYECFVREAPEASPTHKTIQATALDCPSELDGKTHHRRHHGFLPAHYPSWCCTGCWGRKAIKALSQLWASYAATLTGQERCVHWYNRGTSCIGVTKHFLIFLSECECIPCARENGRLVL